MKEYQYILSREVPSGQKYSSSNLALFETDQHGDSASQHYDIKSSNTNSSMVIVCPSGWLISLNQITWLSQITINPTDFQIPETRIYVKLLTGEECNYTGIITNTIAGALHEVNLTGEIVWTAWKWNTGEDMTWNDGTRILENPT